MNKEIYIGDTSDYVLMSLDVFFTGMQYLGVDWESELGTQITELHNAISRLLPETVTLYEPEN